MKVHEEYSFQLKSAERGLMGTFRHLIIRQFLQVQSGTGNDDDSFPVAILPNTTVVGHLPQKSHAYFLQRGGHVT